VVFQPEPTTLPAGCSELRRTTDPDSPGALKQHLDDIPSLNQQHFSRLNKIAIDDQNAGTEVVLGVSDLLRRRTDGSVTLHPRVIQVLSPNTVDATLAHLVDSIDERIHHTAYQYPNYLVEVGEKPQERPMLCPGEYSIDVLDAVRDLRANNILTSIRLRGQSPLDISTLKQTVKRMEQNREPVEGTVRLLLSDRETSSEYPVVVIEEREDMLGRRSSEELVDLCETVKVRFLAPFLIRCEGCSR